MKTKEDLLSEAVRLVPWGSAPLELKKGCKEWWLHGEEFSEEEWKKSSIS